VQEGDVPVGIQDNLEGVQVNKLFTSKRWIAIAGVTAAVVLASGGAAYAYFTSSGSGTGSATVGSAGNWTVVPDPTTGSVGTIYPGSGSSVLTFDVTNSGGGDEQYSSAIASVKSPSGDNGNITDGGSEVQHCKADWFDASVTSDPHINENISPNGMFTIQVTVSMPADASDDQTACAGQSPDVTLALS
jgi:hypothetical protein